MPRQPEQPEIWECTEAHACELIVDGKPQIFVFRIADRVPAEHPAREANPHFFAPFGSVEVSKAQGRLHQ